MGQSESKKNFGLMLAPDKPKDSDSSLHVRLHHKFMGEKRHGEEENRSIAKVKLAVKEEQDRRADSKRRQDNAGFTRDLA
jgi:hypothetical protein